MVYHLNDMKDITIKGEDITSFIKKGSQLVFKKEAEDAIEFLMKKRDEIDTALAEIKKGIEEAGMSVSKDFKGVIGSKVKAIYRVYGEKYEYDWSRKEEVAEYLKIKTYFSVNSTMVDAYIEKNGKLPDGITEKPRSPVISLSLVKPKLEDGKEKV